MPLSTAIMPCHSASASSLLCSSSAAARRRHSPYTPPAPRRSSFSQSPPDSSMPGAGAVYIGWGEGKRDPAPLCCPVVKKAMVERFGEAAVGWMTVPATTPKPKRVSPLPSLIGVRLPPLPPLPSLPRPPKPGHLNLSPSPDIPVNLASPPSYSFSTTSTPPSSLSPSLEPVPPLLSNQRALPSSLSPSTASFEEALYQQDSLTSSSIFDNLSLTLSFFPSTPLSSGIGVSSRPPSPRLGFTPSSKPANLDPIAESERAEEGEAQEDFTCGEILWSVGEEGGLMYHGSEVDSEASWAW